MGYYLKGAEFQFWKILEKAWVGRPVLSPADASPFLCVAHTHDWNHEKKNPALRFQAYLIMKISTPLLATSLTSEHRPPWTAWLREGWAERCGGGLPGYLHKQPPNQIGRPSVLCSFWHPRPLLNQGYGYSFSEGRGDDSMSFKGATVSHLNIITNPVSHLFFPIKSFRTLAPAALGA